MSAGLRRRRDGDRRRRHLLGDVERVEGLRESLDDVRAGRRVLRRIGLFVFVRVVCTNTNLRLLLLGGGGVSALALWRSRRARNLARPSFECLPGACQWPHASQS